MLARGKYFNALCARAGGLVQQAGVQPMIQEQMGRQDTEHGQ
jgi:hypothetical protein